MLIAKLGQNFNLRPANLSGLRLKIPNQTLTMTTPACPLGEMMSEEIKAVLRDRFPDTPNICVELVWDPPWSPDMMSEAARRQLGML